VAHAENRSFDLARHRPTTSASTQQAAGIQYWVKYGLEFGCTISFYAFYNTNGTVLFPCPSLARAPAML
jgi:hypothetical protein